MISHLISRSRHTSAAYIPLRARKKSNAVGIWGRFEASRFTAQQVRRRLFCRGKFPSFFDTFTDLIIARSLIGGPTGEHLPSHFFSFQSPFHFEVWYALQPVLDLAFNNFRKFSHRSHQRHYLLLSKVLHLAFNYLLLHLPGIARLKKEIWLFTAVLLRSYGRAVDVMFAKNAVARVSCFLHLANHLGKQSYSYYYLKRGPLAR